MRQRVAKNKLWLRIAKVLREIGIRDRSVERKNQRSVRRRLAA